jgi:CO/xanthine dehydrogenase FAD-binding subunit
MPTFLRPATLEAALAALAEAEGATKRRSAPPLIVIAGATDLYPARAARQAWLQAFPRDFLDITAIPELTGISEDGRALRIGAATTFTEIAETSLPPAFDALRQAAAQIGGRQIQNRATLAGNIVNASPAADGVPPLMALDAAVEIASIARTRSVPLASFIRGNRRTELARDELVTAIRVPGHRPSARSVFLKLGARSHLVISIASIALLVDAEPDGSIADIRITVGACSAVPARLAALEAELRGEKLEAALADRVTPAMLSALAPIDDVRASAAYRLDAARILVRRALSHVIGQVGMEEAAA